MPLLVRSVLVYLVPNYEGFERIFPSTLKMLLG